MVADGMSRGIFLYVGQHRQPRYLFREGVRVSAIVYTANSFLRLPMILPAISWIPDS